MKVKRLRAALSESDKENVGETESQYEAELKSMSGTNEEVRNDEQNVKGHEEVQAVSDEISQVDEEYLSWSTCQVQMNIRMEVTLWLEIPRM